MLKYLYIILFILTLLIISLISIINLNFIKNLFYNLNLIILIIFLFLSFCSINYFLFYLSFERRLIPTFLLILGWGYQPERLNARIYIFMYTIFSSLPLIILIFYLFFEFNSLRFYILILTMLRP